MNIKQAYYKYTIKLKDQEYPFGFYIFAASREEADDLVKRSYGENLESLKFMEFDRD